MGNVRDISEKLWRGELTTAQPEGHPFYSMVELEEVTSDVGFYKAFSNITAVRTGDGLVLIDTGSFHPVAQERAHGKIRGWSPDRLHTAIYTHGHVDHAYGLPPFLEEAKQQRWPRPEIIAHHDVPARMDRYIETAGYNEIINLRQFGQAIQWPTDPIRPTQTYVDRLELRVGDCDFHLVHARGETDDHTWVFLPRQRVLCTGDLFIWAVPNAGNPQKVQRYCIDWCHALRQMAALEPEYLLPGHGVLIEGQQRVSQALLDTADYLESLYRQTVDLMNDGASIEQIIHAVHPPQSLADKSYLQPVYDEPEFIVRNIHRCLGGWYTGVASELKPAPRNEQAAQIVALAGGVEPLLQRAGKLADEGRWRLACHLVDWAADVEPDSREVHQLRASVYERRAESETSTMAQGIFAAASAESAKKLDPENADGGASS